MMHGTAIVAVLATAVATAVLTSSPDGKAARSPEQQAHQTPDPDLLAKISLGLLGDIEAPREIERTVEVRQGDTLMKLMRAAGVAVEEAHEAIAALREVFDPRELRSGQRITLSFRTDDEAGGDRTFVGLHFDPSAERAIRVERSEQGFNAEALERHLDVRPVRISAAIDSNLYTAGTGAGLPPTTLIDLIRLFSWDVDFQRDIQPGDRFDIMIERHHSKDGRIARYGDILFAELTLSGTAHRLYRFESEKYGVGYYDEKGHSARKALLKTPIDGARLSSGFGKRHHPILGYTKMHRGLDFAAPQGTPIYAAGHGHIEVIGRNGAYGNYIRIRHDDRYASAYAHMSRFAQGLRRGARIKQGQVIGYVGSTGRSTGPHLHYEVLVRNKQINPLSVKVPSGRQLAGKELAAFREVQGEIKTQLAELEPETRISQR